MISATQILVPFCAVAAALPMTDRRLRQLRAAGAIDWLSHSRYSRALLIDWPRARSWWALHRRADLDQLARDHLPRHVVRELIALGAIADLEPQK